MRNYRPWEMVTSRTVQQPPDAYLSLFEPNRNSLYLLGEAVKQVYGVFVLHPRCIRRRIPRLRARGCKLRVRA